LKFEPEFSSEFSGKKKSTSLHGVIYRKMEMTILPEVKKSKEKGKYKGKFQTRTSHGGQDGE